MKTIILTLTLIVLFVSCSEKKKTSNTDHVVKSVESVTLTKEQIKNTGIQFGLAEKMPIGLIVYANGTIEVPPQNKTVVCAQFGGFIKSLKVLDGMSVKKGQTLLTLEDPELIQLQQDYLEVVGNLEYLEAETNRQKLLVTKEAGSLKAFQQAKSQYNAALAKKSGLSSKLKMAGVNFNKLSKGEIQEDVAIIAPFSGVVTKVAVDVGAYAAPTDHLLEIIDLQHAHAEVIVFEKDVKKLKIGQRVSLLFADENEQVDATIFLIGKEIAKDRSVKVHCHLNKENSLIAPGSFFKAKIHCGVSEQYCVPSEAIVEYEGKNVVFCPLKKSGNATRFIPEEVTLIASDEAKTAIRFTNPNRLFTDRIVFTGAYDILSAVLIQSEE